MKILLHFRSGWYWIYEIRYIRERERERERDDKVHPVLFFVRLAVKMNQRGYGGRSSESEWQMDVFNVIIWSIDRRRGAAGGGGRGLLYVWSEIEFMYLMENYCRGKITSNKNVVSDLVLLSSWLMTLAEFGINLFWTNVFRMLFHQDRFIEN